MPNNLNSFWQPQGVQDSMNQWKSFGSSAQNTSPEAYTNGMGFSETSSPTAFQGASPTTPAQDSSGWNWSWNDTMDANGNKQSGIGSTAIGLGNLGLQAYMGWKQLGMAEDQLSHNKETFAYNKSAQERAYRDNQDYNKRVAAALG